MPQPDSRLPLRALSTLLLLCSGCTCPSTSGALESLCQESCRIANPVRAHRDPECLVSVTQGTLEDLFLYVFEESKKTNDIPPVMLLGLCWDLLWGEAIVITGGALEPVPTLVRFIFLGGVDRLLTPLLRILNIRLMS